MHIVLILPKFVFCKQWFAIILGQTNNPVVGQSKTTYKKQEIGNFDSFFKETLWTTLVMFVNINHAWIPMKQMQWQWSIVLYTRVARPAQ